jgi:hypothetical protein
MNIIFIFLALIHIFVWMFVLFAFLNKKTAYFNINYFIPLIYILHILPFHIIVKLKHRIYEPDEVKNNESLIDKMLFFPKIYKYMQNKLYSYCTFNPLSPQGMLIFGLISSYYSLKNFKLK